MALDPEFFHCLEGCNTASLSTVDPEGKPHACNLWFAMDDQQRIYFVSSLESAHSRHVIHSGQVALTVYAETDHPRHIRGAQIHGRCVAVPPPPEGDANAWQHAWDTYMDKYPFLLEDEMFRKAVEAQSFFCIVPHWVRWTDNRKGFGFKVERRIDVPGPEDVAEKSD